MIHHIVMFRLEGEPELKAELTLRFKKAIEALPAQIADLHEVKVMPNENPAEQWTLVLIASTHSWEQLAAYSAHPAHLAAVAIIKDHILQRACVDYEL